jgi:hypothetical protein
LHDLLLVLLTHDLFLLCLDVCPRLGTLSPADHSRIPPRRAVAPLRAERRNAKGSADVRS